jgi:hypothetical protein
VAQLIVILSVERVISSRTGAGILFAARPSMIWTCRSRRERLFEKTHDEHSAAMDFAVYCYIESLRADLT